MSINGGESNPDVLVQDEGTLVVFHLQSTEAKEWVEAMVYAESHQWMGNALAVEHRYASDIANGMERDGLLLRAA